MFKFSFCAFLLLLSVVMNAAAADDDEFCVIKGITIKKGKSASAPIGECSQYTCVSAGSISGKTCALFQPGPNCKRSDYDYTKPYPDCCPKPIC